METSQVSAVLKGRQRHERVVDRAAGDPQPTEYLREASGHFGPQQQRLDEPLVE